MPVAACLWRRTGEIYKGNRQFAELVGVDDYMLRDVSCAFSLACSFGLMLCYQGRLCIYEVMAEESAVNYWEVSSVIYLTPSWLLSRVLAEYRILILFVEIWPNCV